MSTPGHSLSEIERLRWENAVLKEKNWATTTKNGKLKRSEWFFLVNTRHKPSNGNPGLERSQEYGDLIMANFARAVRSGEIITLNKSKHEWNSDFIESVKIRYVTEIGKGKLKKNGQPGKVGGTVHFHVLLTVFHRSNISLEWESLYEFFQPYNEEYFFQARPFVGHPKLIAPNRIEEYMEKGFETAHWSVVEV